MKVLLGCAWISYLFLLSCEKMDEKKTYYPNKQLKEKWSYTKQGSKEIKNGAYSSWYENGEKKDEFFFLDGKKHGLQKSYYENGKYKIKQNYIHGELSGKVKKYDNKGLILSIVTYINGKKNGPAKDFYQSGKLRNKVNFLNDQKDGVKISFSEDKAILNAIWFAQGEQTLAPADSAQIVQMEMSKALPHRRNK